MGRRRVRPPGGGAFETGGQYGAYWNLIVLVCPPEAAERKAEQPAAGMPKGLSPRVYEIRMASASAEAESRPGRQKICGKSALRAKKLYILFFAVKKLAAHRLKACAAAPRLGGCRGGGFCDGASFGGGAQGAGLALEFVDGEVSEDAQAGPVPCAQRCAKGGAAAAGPLQNAAEGGAGLASEANFWGKGEFWEGKEDGGAGDQGRACCRMGKARPGMGCDGGEKACAAASCAGGRCGELLEAAGAGPRRGSVAEG